MKDFDAVSSNITVGGEHFGNITFEGELQKNSHAQGRIHNAVVQVLEGKKPDPIDDLHLIPYYERENNAVILRYRHPEGSGVSKPMATITMSGTKTLKDAMVAKIMVAIQNPDTDKYKPQRGTRRHKAKPS